MKTAIVYYSEHHGNTKKLLDAIAAEHDVILINVTKQPKVDLSGFDRIGLASGIYYGGFAKQMLAFAQDVRYTYALNMNNLCIRISDQGR